MVDHVKKILVIAMLDSVHTFRWFETLQSIQGLEFHIFPSGPHRKVHPGLQALAGEGLLSIKIYGDDIKNGLFFWAADRFLGNRLRGQKLATAIKSLKPEVVHVMEFQNAGYLYLAATKKLNKTWRLALTNWGSDLYWFSKYPKHRAKLKSLLKHGDIYSAECKRDYGLATDLGFSGDSAPCLPNSFDPKLLNDARELLPPEQRKIILVKGYQGWAGMAVMALRAIESQKQLLSGYEVVVFSSSASTRFQVLLMKLRGFRNITAYKKFSFNPAQMTDLFSKARIYLGISKTDGISTSVLEAMAFGAFPIQSKTSCSDEWLDSSSGILVANDELEIAAALASAIRITDTKSDFQKRNSNELATRCDAQGFLLRANVIYKADVEHS